MSLALLSPLIVLTAATCIVLLERRFPYSPGQMFFRAGFWNDLILYSIVQSYLLGVAINYLIVWMDSSTGLSRFHLISDWPLWTQVLFFVVTHDLYIYWFHRLQHRSLRLWRLHEAHHSTTDVDWLSGSRSHALEILINQTVEFAPIVLLGAAPEVALLKGMISAVWGMWIHSNIDVHSGVLQYVINGPEMHRWHHSDVVADGSNNFATKFALWDWLFDTAHLPVGKKPTGYGIREIDFPTNYIRQHLFAFRPLMPDEYQPNP
ncbi:MAG: sterol desaturase family protein [Bacteroidetes bacterium]|nr:sterol desaturase family protein [Bacteroidota bacterium]